MKKIILFIMSFLFVANVNAKTYYSDYGEYKSIEEKVEKSDIVDLKTEEKYLIYKESKTEAFYPSYMEIDDMVKTDETKIVTSPWLDEKPNKLIGRNIIERELYEYQNMKKIRYIKITNMINESGLFEFSEFIAINNLGKVEYDIVGSNEEINKIRDADLTTYVPLESNAEVIIDLKDPIDINDLKIGFHVHITKNTDIYYTLELYGEEFKNIYAEKSIHSSVGVDEDNNAFYFIDKSYFDLVSPLYQEKQLSENKVVKNKFNIVNLVTKYKTEDLYIKYEKIEREYLDDYYLEPIEGYKLDLESKKEFCYIRTRDKVEISDNLIIRDYDTKLEDLIISTTTNDIKITSNMNYYKNGTYDIYFVLPFKTIKEKLIIDISDNYIKALEFQNKYLKDLEEENKNLIINNNKLNNEIKEILISKDKAINEVNDKIIECRYELEESKKNKQDLRGEITEGKNYTILIIIPIILGLILILLYLRKKSIQNNN